MQLVKLYDTSSVPSLQHSFLQKQNHPKKVIASRGLISKQDPQSFIKYSKPFISEVSVLGKIMFKFMMTLISSKSVSKYVLGFAGSPIFLF